MYKSAHKIFIKKSLLNSQILGSILIFVYCAMYGVSSYAVLTGAQLIFFLFSLIFALSIVYVRDPQIRKEKIKKGLLYNQVVGMALVFGYIVFFGASSIALMSGIQLVFFMSSYTFAMSLFYIRDPERIKKAEEENVSTSVTSSPFVERNPCFINSQDLSWLVRELNDSLSTVIGFSELILRGQYNESEKDYMIRNIYEKALSMSNSVNKVSGTISDSLAKPKEIHEVVDLLADSNFK